MSTTLPPDNFTILALETSCDETSAAIVRGGREVVANVVASQLDAHRRYGGIVPEVASRQHILSLAPVIEEVLAALPGGWDEIHAIAATHGPGLSGALLTGLNAAKAIAWQRGLPFVGVNHLEAHIYANWLVGAGAPPAYQAPEFPLVALVVSGGHTLLALLRDHGTYQLLGQTRDDAAGEAFDKVARILGLDYPGGPAIQQAALGAQGGAVLPRAWLRDSYDFSFSGLKTAVLHRVQEQQEREARVTPAKPQRPPARTPGKSSGKPGDRETAKPGDQELGAQVSGEADETQNSKLKPQNPKLTPQFVAQTASAFQESVVDVLVTKTINVAQRFGATAILLAGGVAANTRLREELTRRARGLPVRYPPIALCTDNAAMVAAAAYYRFTEGKQHDWALDVTANLPLGR